VAIGCVLAATLSGSLAACAGPAATPTTTPITEVPGVGGTVAVGIDQAPTGCNPNTATGNTYADDLVLSSVLPSAFTVDGQGQSGYDQALIVQAEVQSTSPETVVYTLNPKAVWSDGTPITATDFIYAWQHQRSVPLGSSGGDADVASTAGYDDISTMTPSNRGRTLTVVFSTPYADWQRLFSDLLPAHVLEHAGWSPPCSSVDPSVDLSGGPYEIASVTKSAVTLVRNPRWWEQPPKVARIVVRFASGPQQLAHWMYEREIDVAAPSSFDAPFLQEVTSMPFVKSALDVSDTFLELEFSTTGTATADPLVRQGIAYLIDRQDLSDKVAGWADVAIAPSVSHLYSQEQNAYPNSPAPVPANATTTTTSTTQPASTAVSAATFPTGADLDLATRDLVAAGYSHNGNGQWVDFTGRPLALRLAVDEGDGWAAQAAEFLADQLRSQGVTVSTLAEPDAAGTGTALSEDRADVALLPLAAGPYPTETSAWYSPLLDLPGSTGAEDWSGYASVKVDNLFALAATQLDPVTAQPIYNQIDQQLWTDMVALPLFAEPVVLAWSASVAGVTPGPYGAGLFSSVLTWARLVSEPANYAGTPRLPS